MADDLAGWMVIGEQMAPMVEFVEGERHKLEERGWSPTAAETFALELLLGLLRASFAQGANR